MGADWDRVNVSRRVHCKRVAMDKARQELFAFLGGKCAGCGIADYRVIHFDHVRDDAIPSAQALGYKHRTTARSARYYRLMLEECRRDAGFLRVLCANCHAIRHWEDDRAGINIGGE